MVQLEGHTLVDGARIVWAGFSICVLGHGGWFRSKGSCDLATGEVINIQNHSQAAQLLGMSAEATAAQPRPRAAMVILARDQDLDGVLLSMRRLEARFNNSQYRHGSCGARPVCLHGIVQRLPPLDYDNVMEFWMRPLNRLLKGVERRTGFYEALRGAACSRQSSTTALGDRFLAVLQWW